MKKLLSVILAGALALTAVSPAFAATSAYENSRADGLYYDVDFSKATGVADGGSLAGYIGTASNSELLWQNRGDGNAITKVEDPIKGTVAKITTGGTMQPRIWLKKGNHKNAFDNTVSTNSTIHEFSFKVADNYTSRMFFRDYDNEPNGGDWPHFYFETDGSIVGKRSGTVANAFKTNGEWNHVVIEYATVAINGRMSNTVYVWVNGVQVGYNGASSGAANFTSDTWKETYLAFCAGDDTTNGIAEQDIYISNFTKYELAEGVTRYKPADAGNTPATITSSSNDVLVVGNQLFYNASKVTTTTELLSNLTVSTGTTPLVVMETEGEEWLAGDDVALASEDGTVKYVVAKSTSGDQLTYYTVGEQEATQVAYGDKVTVNETALTVSFKEVDLPTVGDLADQFTATGGSAVKFFDASGNEITDRTASATTVKTVSTYSITGMVKIDYAVSCSPAIKTFVSIDFPGNSAHTPDNQTANSQARGLNVGYRAYGVSFAKEANADFGVNVQKIVTKESNTNWGGFANIGTTADITLGDKVIIETTIKPDAAGVPNSPSLGWSGGSTSASNVVFDFGASQTNSRSTIYTMGDMTTGFPYQAGKWYHIVAEYTPTASGSTVRTWINGIEQPSATSSNLTLDKIKSDIQTTEKLRLGKSVTSSAGVTTSYDVALFTVYRSAFAYDPTGEDAAAVTTENEAITIDPVKATINVIDTSMTVATLKDELTVSAGATVKYLGADGAEVADTAAVGTVKSITVLSSSKNRHVAYDVTNVNVTSSAYTVTDGAISGVKMYTTVAQLKDNLSAVENIDVFMADDKWISNGDVVTVGTVDYTVALEDVAHVDGTALPADGFNKGHFSYTPQFVADATRGGDTVLYIPDTHRKYTKADGKEGDQYARICFPGGTPGTNGSGTPQLQPGESANIEFAMKADGKVYGHLIVNNNFVWYLDGEVMGVNQPSSGNNYTLNPFNISPMSYTIGEWMHVVSAVTRDAETGNYMQKLYINGDLVHQDGTSTQNRADALVLEILGYDKDVEVDIWLDDIKYYYTETWGFDANWQYDTELVSYSEDVTVANGEVWLSNGAAVADAIGVDVYDVDGAVIEDLEALTAGDKFYVYSGPIIKPFAVKEGAIGTAVAADGTLTATVGMVADTAKAALFVAGIGADNKFTNIVKVVKASGSDDTIVYDLNKVGADTVKVYVWDASLTSLTDVATYTKTEGSWN